jgi:Fe-S cluster assembly scaffold protein SufB
MSCNTHKISNDQISLIIIPDHANLAYDLVQDYTFFLPDHHTGIVTLQVMQSVTAQVTIYCAGQVDLTVRLIMINAQAVDINLSVILCGDNSRVSVLGLCALHKQQSVVFKTHQIHCGKNSQSSLVLQGLLTGQARLQYDGTIRIEKDASGTYALQNNKNILLSDTAHAVSIPNIEVLNHDVQCYHGAAVGKFDDLQIEYMQSRGLGYKMIQQLLVQAFCQPVLQGYEKKDVVLQNVYEKL